MEPKDYVVAVAVLVFSIVSFGISRWLQQRTKNTDLVIDENRRKAEQRSSIVVPRNWTGRYVKVGR